MRAIEYLIKSATCYEEVHMPLRAQLLRYRLGEIHPGPDSRHQHDRAELWLKDQGIVARRDGRACTLPASPRLPVTPSKRPIED